MTTKTINVYDPAMCCSTGICGPSVDPQLVRFAADLDWLKSQGVAVTRFNLSQQPAAFAADADVRKALEEKGEAALPLIAVDGAVRSVGQYPSRDELAGWTGVEATAPAVATAGATAGATKRAPLASIASSDCCTPSADGASDGKSCC